MDSQRCKAIKGKSMLRMFGLRIFGVALSTLMLAIAPAQATLIYQGAAPSLGGIAELYDGVYDPAVGATGSLWVTIDQGSFSYAEWTLDGEQQILWWDQYYDDDGNPVPYLNGNEYYYSPTCNVTPGAPSCGSAPLTVTLLAPRLLRIDFVRPTGYNNCEPYPGQGDCATSYSIPGANFGFDALAAGTTTFRILDTNPVPEPAVWLMLVGGFGLVGGVLRQGRRALA